MDWISIWALVVTTPVAWAGDGTGQGAGGGGSSPVASPADPGPAAGEWELRFPVGGAVNSTGQPLDSTSQGLFGFTFSRAFSRQVSLDLGLSGAVDKDFLGGSALVGLRYRAWDANSVVKPFVTGGILHSWYFPRAGKNRNTITAATLRTGFGLDFAITSRALWSVEVDFDAGPRILPATAAFVNAVFTAGFLFRL